MGKGQKLSPILLPLGAAVEGGGECQPHLPALVLGTLLCLLGV